MADEQPKTHRAALDSAYFDQWYADMETSPTMDVILRRHLGIPSWLGSAGVLAWEALDEIEDGLRLPEGGVLVDVACGLGGYGIELARRTGAALVGVDFSRVALARVRAIAARHLPAERADFRVGTLIGTGLAAGSAHALMCTDSVQFAQPPARAVGEFARVLRSGGRLAVTPWQATTADDPLLGARLHHLDLTRDLSAAGFDDIVVETRPAWRSAEREMWQEAVATGDDTRDEALRSLREEGRSSLQRFDALQRVIAFATAP